MRNKTFYLVIILFPFYLIGQIKMDNWYKVEAPEFKGYLHYKITEDDSNYTTNLEFKIRVENEILTYKANLLSEKDQYMTLNKFKITRNSESLDDSESFNFSGNVKKENNTFIWSVDDSDFSMKTAFPTVIDWNLFYILTKLAYQQKGTLLNFNSVEIEELNYKENHTIAYVLDEILTIDNKKIKTKKIEQKGDGIMGSSFWINEKNELVKFSIDNYKNYTLCKKEDINFSELEVK